MAGDPIDYVQDRARLLLKEISRYRNRYSTFQHIIYPSKLVSEQITNVESAQCRHGGHDSKD